MKPYKLVALLFVLFAAQSYAYTTHIVAPAVISGADRGVLTNVTLVVGPGTGKIIVNNGSDLVALDTIQSVQTAVVYATNYLNVSPGRYNFDFIIGNNDSNVSGPSAGLAMTLLTLSGIEQKPLFGNFTVTGTINPDGSVGTIGGVYDKIQAAKSVGSEFILVPYVNNTTSEYLLYYLSQQTYSTPVIEVKNVTQAIPYAFGDEGPTWLDFNITTNYMTSQVPSASAVCPECNGSAFVPLVNFTFNYTNNEISAINGTIFGSVKSQLYGQLQQSRQLAAKGYYYTGADLAFIEDPTAFMFANYNTSPTAAALIINNISAYCESLNYSVNTTSANYEFVVGGRTRLAWAMMTLSAAEAALNASETSDEVLLSLQEAAPAQSWCAATGEMYAIAASIGGNATTTSSRIKAQVMNQLDTARMVYGNQLYVAAANYSASNGDYASALYSLTYANTFYNSSGVNYNATPALVSNALSSAQGVWPTQFALQSAFYLNEANLNKGTSSKYLGYLSDAYTTAMLSSSLDRVDAVLKSNFVQAPSATSAVPSFRGPTARPDLPATEFRGHNARSDRDIAHDRVRDTRLAHDRKQEAAP